MHLFEGVDKNGAMDEVGRILFGVLLTEFFVESDDGVVLGVEASCPSNSNGGEFWRILSKSSSPIFIAASISSLSITG